MSKRKPKRAEVEDDSDLIKDEKGLYKVRVSVSQIQDRDETGDFKVVGGVKGKGGCPFGHKVGDVFDWPEDRGKICVHVLHTIYPLSKVMRYGGVYPPTLYPGLKDPDARYRACADPWNEVIFKVERVKKSAK